MITTIEIVSAKIEYQNNATPKLLPAQWLEILDLAYEEARYREYARSNPGGFSGPAKKASCADERIAYLEKENQKLEERCDRLARIVKEVHDSVVDELERL